MGVNCISTPTRHIVHRLATTIRRLFSAWHASTGSATAVHSAIGSIHATWRFSAPHARITWLRYRATAYASQITAAGYRVTRCGTRWLLTGHLIIILFISMLFGVAMLIIYLFFFLCHVVFFLSQSEITRYR